MAYDTSRGLLVMYGGIDGDSDFDDTWTFDGHAWTAVTSASGPPALDSVPMVYDPALGAVVLVDGSGSTWTFDGATWRNVANVGTNAGGGSMAWLPPIQELVLLDSAGKTWIFDGTSWSLSGAASPGARLNASMVYDAHLGSIVLFGGSGGHDTWSFDGLAWTLLSPSTFPPGRSNATLVYDPIAGRSVLFGGTHFGSSYSDTWSFDGTTWTQLTPIVSPSRRWGASGDFMASIGRIVTFGGYLDNASSAMETWSFEGSTWGQIALPPALEDVAEDPSGGGLLGIAGDGSTWRWDGGTWMQLPVAIIPNLSGAALATDAARGRDVMLTTTGDTWTWNGTAWTQVAPAHSPGARIRPAMTWDPARGVVVLFGGVFIGPLDDTWTWDGTDWTTTAPVTTAPGRGYAGFASDPISSGLLLYGGIASAVYLDDTWLWNGSTWAGLPVELPSGGPASMATDTEIGQTVLLDNTGAAWAWNGTEWYGQTNAIGLPAGALGYWGATRQLVDTGGSDTWVSSDAVGQISVSLLSSTLLPDGVDSTTATALVTDAGGHPAPGLPVHFEASGGQAIGPVTDHLDGTYSATLTAGAEIGSYTLVARALTLAARTTFQQSGQQVSLSPSRLAFGSQGLGATTAPLSITVTSTGTSPVSFGPSTLTGTNPDDFTITSDGCRAAGSIPHGGSCTVGVTFTPKQPGSRSATLAINDSAPGAPRLVSLGGEGTSLAFSPASLDFGTVTQGQSAGPVTVTILNDSPGTVNIAALLFTGAAKDDFATTSDTCSGAAVGSHGTCTVGVIFSPLGAGSRSAFLNVTSSSPDSPATMMVSGTGLAVAAAGSVDPSFESFGSVTVSSSASAGFRLTSTGTGPLSVSGVSIVPDQTPFTVTQDGCTGANLAPGQDCEVSVTFAPTQMCSFSATLSFAGNGGTQTVFLDGEGVSPLAPGKYQPVFYCTSHAAEPQELAARLDGSVWFDERGSAFASPAIGSVTSAAGVREFPDYVTPYYAPYEITSAPDGSTAWFEARGAGYATYVHMVDAIGNSTTLPSPGVDSGPLGVGPDGAFWYASGYSCGTTPLVTRFAMGTAPVSYTPTFNWMAAAFGVYDCAEPYSVTTGPDGTLWIGLGPSPHPVDSPSGFLRVSTDGVFLDFVSTYPNGYPSAATLGSDGYLYALVGNGGSQCSLERFTSAESMTPVPLGDSVFAGCGSLVTGPDGLLWLAGNAFDASQSSIRQVLISVNPATFAVHSYPAPATGYVAAGSDEGLWFNSVPSAVGRFDLGGGPSRALVTPQEVGFPSTAAGVASGTRTVTVRSTGTAPLTIQGVSLLGADPSQFILTGNSCTGGTVLAPGDGCVVTVQSRPQAAGSHYATLVISDDDAWGQQIVRLDEFTVPPPPRPVPSSVAFPTTSVNQKSSTSFTVKLKNPGDTPLRVTSADLGGTNPGDFFFVTDQCETTTIPAGGDCSVKVGFNPMGPGRRTATLTFTDAATPMTQTAVLSGTGQASSGTGGSCQCLSTGPFADPVVVDPVADATSPGGKYKLSVSPAFGSPTLFTITGASGAVVASIPEPSDAKWPALYGWGFSPDDDRFAIHYAWQGTDIIELYDLTSARPATPAWTSGPLAINPGGSGVSPAGSIGFSPAGHYLVATQIQTPSNDTYQSVRLFIVPAAGGNPAPFTWNPVPAPGETDAVVGSSFWGFSPDDESFTFIRRDANGNPTLQLISLPSQTVVQELSFTTGFSYWAQYAPCGEVEALRLMDPNGGTNPVSITLYATDAAAARQGGVGTPPVSEDLPAADPQIEAAPSGYTVTFTGYPNTVPLGANLTAGGSCAPPKTGSPGGGSSAPEANQKPVFTDDTPPLKATDGFEYSYTFDADGAAPIFYSLQSSPSWLKIDPTSGKLTGTVPAGTGSFNYTVDIHNAVGDNSAGPYNVTVHSPSAPFFTSAAPSLSATANVKYSYLFKADGSPDPTFALDSDAPSWLSIDSDTGQLTGTPPSGVTTFTYSVTASNGVDPDATAGPFDVGLSFITAPPLPAGALSDASPSADLLPPPTAMILPGGRGEIDLPADVTPAISEFDYTEVDVPPGPLGGLTFAGLDFTFIATDASTGSNVTSFVDPPLAIIAFRPADLRALRIRDASTLGLYWWNGTEWVNQLPCTGCGVDPAAGTVTAFLTQVGEFALAAAIPPPPAPVVTPAAISARAGSPFSDIVATFPPQSAQDTPDFYSATINWGDGQVSAGSILVTGPGAFAVAGTHTWSAAGQDAVVITVLSGSVSGSAQATAIVAPSSTTPPAFTASTPPLAATVGVPYGYTFAASGAPVPTFALAAGAPAWLAINATSGALSGTPTSGVTSFAYSVVASNGVSPAATAGPFVVSVNAPPAFTVATPPLAATVGVPYGFTFAASGAPAPTFALAAGAPAWLAINATSGALSGTPTSGVTSFAYSVVASNGVSPAATAGPFVVTVSAPTGTTADLAISLVGPSTAARGSSVSYTATLTNRGPATAVKVKVVVSTNPEAWIILGLPSGGHREDGTMAWSLASLAPGQTRAFTIVVRPFERGPLSVRAKAASATPDPNSTNNAAVVMTAIK